LGKLDLGKPLAPFGFLDLDEAPPNLKFKMMVDEEKLL